MSYQALARKWRPRNFSQLVGQQHVRTALENALSQGRLHPALLFSGTRGVGKTTLARIIASCLNCETGVTATPCGECSACQEIEQGRFVDLIEVDAASRTKVDETRELLDNVPYAPARGRYKVYLIDEVHMLTKHSFNALLKTLEEPPGHVQFLFATTDPQKLPITILSRCLQFHLKRIQAADIAGRMAYILERESIQAEDEGLQRLARAADGSLRDGLSLLDQAIAFGGGEVTATGVASMLGSIERRDLLDIVAAVAAQDAAQAWQAIDHIEEQGLDFVEVLDELCRLWQRLAVGQQVPEAWDDVERADLNRFAEQFRPEDVQVFYQIAVNARRDMDWAPDPRSGFEMTVLRTLAFLPEAAAAGAAGGSAPPSARPVAAASGQTSRPAAQSASPVPDTAAASPAAQAPAKQAMSGESRSLADQSWQQIVARLDLPGVNRMVAESCEREIIEEGHWQLQVGPEASALCTPAVEQRIREQLQQALGEELRLSFNRQIAEEAKADVAAELKPEEKFLAEPGVRRMIEMFDAQMQPGTLRISEGQAGESSEQVH